MPYTRWLRDEGCSWCRLPLVLTWIAWQTGPVAPDTCGNPTPRCLALNRYATSRWDECAASQLQAQGLLRQAKCFTQWFWPSGPRSGERPAIPIGTTRSCSSFPLPGPNATRVRSAPAVGATQQHGKAGHQGWLREHGAPRFPGPFTPKRRHRQIADRATSPGLLHGGKSAQRTRIETEPPRSSPARK